MKSPPGLRSENLGVNPTSVAKLQSAGRQERLAALRSGSIDAANIGGATFIGGGAGSP